MGERRCSLNGREEGAHYTLRYSLSLQCVHLVSGG